MIGCLPVLDEKFKCDAAVQIDSEQFNRQRASLHGVFRDTEQDQQGLAERTL
jgi:hypothetical protein